MQGPQTGLILKPSDQIAPFDHYPLDILSLTFTNSEHWLQAWHEFNLYILSKVLYYMPGTAGIRILSSLI